jgi:tRNA pseudouridine38-40 synthase
MRYRATLSYDGTAYKGFQRQGNHTPTIQLVLENALLQITQQRVSVIAAGRTDAGVHASGQVIAFEVIWKHEPIILLYALNSVLPRDIALQDIAEADEDFHPRFSATARRYRYTVIYTVTRQPLLRNAWQINQPLHHHHALHSASQMLIGDYDFGAFGKSPEAGGHTIRTVLESSWHISVQRSAIVYEYEITANAFLKHMVRRITSALVNVGWGKLTLEQFEDSFRRVDSTMFKHTAPPQGLVLEAVFYPANKLVK